MSATPMDEWVLAQLALQVQMEGPTIPCRARRVLRQHVSGRSEALREVELTLDQLWDLLRQRRGREEFGLNPDEAETRDPNTVERYIQ